MTMRCGFLCRREPSREDSTVFPRHMWRTCAGASLRGRHFGLRTERRRSERRRWWVRGTAARSPLDAVPLHLAQQRRARDAQDPCGVGLHELRLLERLDDAGLLLAFDLLDEVARRVECIRERDV